VADVRVPPAGRAVGFSHAYERSSALRMSCTAGSHNCIGPESAALGAAGVPPAPAVLRSLPDVSEGHGRLRVAPFPLPCSSWTVGCRVCAGGEVL
jgi:hypothetical protein